MRKLPLEAKKQAAHVERVDRSLHRLRDLISANALMSSRLPREMLQNCIIPRLLMSPEDAMFCAKFIHRMHDLDMPGFSTCFIIHEVHPAKP